MIQQTDNDARFANIGNLPSNFFPYKNEFKAVNIRQFAVAELKLLSRASVTNDIGSTIKAVDQTIDVPVHRLTIGDFYYILMWHKLHSFPKTPLTVSWECRHNIPVNKDGLIDKSSTHFEVCKHPNAHLIHQSDIDIISLDDDFEGIPSYFDYPRVTLLPEIFEMRDNPEFALLLGAAQWIAQGSSLVEKFEYLESLPDISIFQEAEEINTTVVHGVHEYIKLKCDRCENAFTKRLELNPLNFFRSSL